MWQRIITVDDIDRSYYGSVDAKRTRHVSEVAKGMLSLASGPLVDEEIDVDFWHYRYYGERRYVANLCAMPAELFVSWRSLYMVFVDVLYWYRAILMAQFRYLYRPESLYWNTQVHRERRTFSAFGLFIPYHLMCV